MNQNMDNIVVISQNVRIGSLKKLTAFIRPGSSTLIVSTQLIFENEAGEINGVLGGRCACLNFSDLMSDQEAAQCDRRAFDLCRKNDLQSYYDAIRRLKNQRIIAKILEKYPAENKFIVCDDLGLSLPAWLDAGFTKVDCEYYHDPARSAAAAPKGPKAILSRLRAFAARALGDSVFADFLRRGKYFLSQYRFAGGRPMYVAREAGNIYWFFGSMNRIAYRLRPDFREAGAFDRLRYLLKTLGCFAHAPIFCLSTLHEGYRRIPDRPDMHVKLLQDGYLPPNYSSMYLMFYGKHTEFWTWDVEGRRTFDFHGLPSRVIPIRKKLYLPLPDFPARLKKVLCAASGDGDWTAVKNRSDEDKLVVTFARLAALFPEIEFVFRCHPVWTYPMHQGVNSVNRVAEYFDSLRLPNLKVSSNTPAGEAGCLSFRRSSFDEDLDGVDLVLGEHSIAMVDAGFRKKLFCSVNVTGHRDFYLGMTEMGFPHCESLAELTELFHHIADGDFQARYARAVENYNKMTDHEAPPSPGSSRGPAS